MNARTLRHDRFGGRAGLGLLGILLILGLGCGSNPPAAQEPEPGAAASETANEPVNEPAPSTAPDSSGVAENASAAEPEQASAQQPAESEKAEESAEPVPEPTGELLRLIEESEAAGRQGLSGKSHRLCSQALDMDSRQPRALNVCAIAACNLNNKRLAKRYYGMAATPDQKAIIYQICRSKGIMLRE